MSTDKSTPNLLDRVRKVQAWALSRVEHCRWQEEMWAGFKTTTGKLRAERRALEAVLEQLSPGYLARHDERVATMHGADDA